MCFKWPFKKKFVINENKCKSLPLYLIKKRKTKKIKINSILSLSEPYRVCFCYNNEPYDVFENENNYTLNGNSLPNLFKAGKFNKPNAKNYISPYFNANIWCVTKNYFFLNYKIKSMRFKDADYGAQKTYFAFEAEIKIDNLSLFFKQFLHSFPHSTTKNFNNKLSIWFEKVTRKWLSKHKFTLNDIICYTKAYEDELTSLLEHKLASASIIVKNIKIVDALPKENILNDIINNTRAISAIEKTLKKHDFSVMIDGVEIEKSFEMSARYKVGSLKEKYKNKSMGIIVKRDNSEYKVTTLAGNKDEYGNECDAKIEIGKKCEFCGKLIPTDSTFCPYCANVCE